PSENLPRTVCPSNAFLFNSFRTLLRNGVLATPFPSITSALFPVQRGERGYRASSHPRNLRFLHPGCPYRAAQIRGLSSSFFILFCLFSPLLSRFFSYRYNSQLS